MEGEGPDVAVRMLQSMQQLSMPAVPEQDGFGLIRRVSSLRARPGGEDVAVAAEGDVNHPLIVHQALQLVAKH